MRSGSRVSRWRRRPTGRGFAGPQELPADLVIGDLRHEHGCARGEQPPQPQSGFAIVLDARVGYEAERSTTRRACGTGRPRACSGRGLPRARASFPRRSRSRRPSTRRGAVWPQHKPLAAPAARRGPRLTPRTAAIGVVRVWYGARGTDGRLVRRVPEPPSLLARLLKRSLRAPSAPQHVWRARALQSCPTRRSLLLP